MSGGRFLERWSRLKKVAEKASTAAPVDGESLLENLTAESDFGQFMRQEISEEVRRKAMKTLFADPQFNVMDGLDIYIGDYSVSEAIPEEMLAGMSQMRTLLETPAESDVPVANSAVDCDILAADGQNVPVLPLPDDSPTKNQ